MTLLCLEPKQSFVIFKDLEVVPRLFCQNGIHQRCDPAAIELTIGETRPQHFACDLPDFLFDLHCVCSWSKRRECVPLPPADGADRPASKLCHSLSPLSPPPVCLIHVSIASSCARVQAHWLRSPSPGSRLPPRSLPAVCYKPLERVWRVL